MSVRVLREADVQQLVTMADALAAVETAFKEQSECSGYNTPRHRVHQPNGVLHMMGGALLMRGYWGFKAYTTTRHGARFVVNLYDVMTGELRCMLEADYLGQLRTGAASGIATKYLALEQAHILGLIGTGYQAETQLAAIAAVRDLQEVRVYGRTPEKRSDFAQRMGTQLGLNVQPVDSPQAAVERAEIITTMTSAREPVFSGHDIAPGAHINAAGSNGITRAELDRTTIRRADAIFVDDLDQAQQESGDLVRAYEANALAWSNVRLLADVVTGRTVGRRGAADITLFESHGIALWDVALAATVYERAEAQGSGSVIEFGA